MCRMHQIRQVRVIIRSDECMCPVIDVSSGSMLRYATVQSNESDGAQANHSNGMPSTLVLCCEHGAMEQIESHTDPSNTGTLCAGVGRRRKEHVKRILCRHAPAVHHPVTGTRRLCRGPQTPAPSPAAPGFVAGQVFSVVLCWLVHCGDE